MYAIVEIGGSQWKVEKNDEILVDLIKNDKGANLKYETVTLLRDDKKIEVGQPYVAKAVVEAKLIDPEVKGEKINIFKYKNKTNYHVKTGHRQKYSRIQITGISTGGSSSSTAAADKAVEVKPAAPKKEAVKTTETKAKPSAPKASTKAAPKAKKVSE